VREEQTSDTRHQIKTEGRRKTRDDVKTDGRRMIVPSGLGRGKNNGLKDEGRNDYF